MIELPIFICYRQDDAMELARWLHHSLEGKTIYALEGSLEIPKTVSVYFDQSATPVDDWQEHLQDELQKASVLVVICSPGAAREFEKDVMYFEIRWWITNRADRSPILITPAGLRWVPEPIKERWPNAQTVSVSMRNPSTQALTDPSILAIATDRIVAGIRLRVRGLHVGNGPVSAATEGRNDSGVLNLPGLYTWEKDRNFRYIRCNENYARAAGFDSPKAMRGKTDDDMPWRRLADFFRRGDQEVMNAESPAREHVHEKEIMVDRVADILVTESQILTKNGACVGVTGYFLDITGNQLVLVPQKQEENEVNLGPEFGNQTLSGIEASVFKGLLRKFSSERISAALNITKAEVDAHTMSIMRKLQCQTLGDVIVTSIRAGLPVFLFGCD